MSDTDTSEDIIVRLRKEAKIVPYEMWSWLHPLLKEAADEIERLRADNNEKSP